MNAPYKFIGEFLEVIDVLIVLFWSVGWLFPKKWLGLRLTHVIVVYTVLVAQLLMWWRCPLTLVSEHLYNMAEPGRTSVDVSNPLLIRTIQEHFGFGFQEANHFLSGMIIAGAIVWAIRIWRPVPAERTESS